MPKATAATEAAFPSRASEHSSRVDDSEGARAIIHRYRQSSVRARVDTNTLVHLATAVAQAEPMEQVEVEREGLPAAVMASLAEAMEVPRIRVFEIMDLPRATMEKKISEREQLTGVANLRTLALLRLLAHAQEILRDSTADAAKDFNVARWLGRWIETPQPALGGKKPADLLDTETGASVVDRTLGAMRSGAYL